MILTFFSSHGWQSWDIEHWPLIPEGMPVLVDDDLRFEDGPAAPRPAAVVNRWLRELPASGAPAPRSWENYARVLKAWAEFLAEHAVGLFDSPDLNPVEWVRAHVKRSLANLAVVALDRLEAPVRNRLKRLQHRPVILDGFIAGTGLTLDTTTSPWRAEVSRRTYCGSSARSTPAPCAPTTWSGCCRGTVRGLVRTRDAMKPFGSPSR